MPEGPSLTLGSSVGVKPSALPTEVRRQETPTGSRLKAGLWRTGLGRTQSQEPAWGVLARLILAALHPRLSLLSAFCPRTRPSLSVAHRPQECHSAVLA